ncbi:hypothetical protein PENSTE_c003G07442 [Penicillium steckii]|uniref:Rhodopsin domain-containing protein n=1 Tax=Penicillium steckii TaxID=303698 RepID=A0A1V6TRS3_9EURO|nr:hypothetical protein PENSTE_c003G07442 [Penicillium steckii]
MGNLAVEDVLGPPPAGMDLSENRAPRDNAVVISLCVLALITVILRFAVRLTGPKPRPELDDWLIAVAIIPLIALLAAAVVVGSWGMGKHIWATSLDKIVEGKKVLFAWLFVYIFELFIIKASILMFYRRIFGMNWMIWTCLMLSVAWLLGSMIALLVCPEPISNFWNEMVDHSGGRYRYNFLNYYIGNAAGNVASDKIMVSVVLLLGVFVCAASIVRLHFITYLKSPDLTWVMSDVYVWSDIEPSLGIICASLPAMQPLVRSVMKMENLLCFSRRKKDDHPPSDCQTRRGHQKQGSNISSIGSEMVPVDNFDGKGELGFQQYDDDVRLTTVVTHIGSEQSRRQKSKLEELLGPGSIRVQHDVEITIK